MATSPPPPPPPPSQSPQLHFHEQYSPADTPPSSSSTPPPKKKRSLPGAPNKYPDAEVIALSPKTLMATNRFICEVCNKGFQREQNLQLHRRGHNLPWKLKQKNSKDPVRKKVYLCPEPTCVHHDPTRALGDLTGIKKHYFRKHGEKKFKCEKCAKRYAVLSDWKAHSKTCGTKEYCCECGTKFSRRDSFTTHRAFCDALNQESTRLPTSLSTIGTQLFGTNGGGVVAGNMGLGMGLSNQLASHHPSMSGQQMTSDILRLGGGAHQFDHLLSTPLRSDQHQNNIQQPQPNFSWSNQGGGAGGYENGGHDQNQRHNIGGGIFSNKQFHGQMNQLPEFQGSAFSLGFFPNNNNNSNSNNNNNNNADTGTMNSGSTGSGDHSSALFSPSGGNDLFGGPPHMSSGGGLSTLYNTGPIHQQQSAMSATALLQKAAQMGSTNSTTNASVNALLKGFLANPPPQPPSPPTSGGGGFGGLYGENNQNNLHDLLIQNLSRDNISDNNNNYYTGFNPNNKSTQGGISAGLSDHMTRDFLGVGEVVRSMNGGGFTTNQGGGNGIGMPNNNLNNADQVSNNNNNNGSNSNINIKNNSNNNVNYSGLTSNQAYDGGHRFQ